MAEATSDEILMAAYQAGSQPAFDVLYQRHASNVYGFLVRRLGDAALAADLYQEAFLRVHRARRSYDPKRPFRTWLFSIVHNLLNDALRKQQRAPRLEAEVETVDEHSPERVAAARESGRALRRGLSALPPDEATVLVLARLEGLSYDEIAAVVGRSPAAVKQLAYRALKRLRAVLRAAGHEETD